MRTQKIVLFRCIRKILPFFDADANIVLFRCGRDISRPYRRGICATGGGYLLGLKGWIVQVILQSLNVSVRVISSCFTGSDLDAMLVPQSYPK